MTDLAIVRALHVLGVVVWIGGVSMATTVGLPALRQGYLGEDRLKAFGAIERRFSWQARGAILLVGLTGLYMLWRMNLWSRFQIAGFWWMHAMVCVWALFAVILFVLEPTILHRRFPRWASAHPEIAFAWLHRAHWILLTLSLITVFGAVAGAQGWSIF